MILEEHLALDDDLRSCRGHFRSKAAGSGILIDVPGKLASWIDRQIRKRLRHTILIL